jgi:hypothetical protein
LLVHGVIDGGDRFVRVRVGGIHVLDTVERTCQQWFRERRLHDGRTVGIF